MALFALVDCNNFYVSCERVFRPDIRNKPIAVLSNNDGVIVSRSQEIKELGVRAGVAYFKVKDELARLDVLTFSSNYTLYGDISNRVFQTLRGFSENLEIYSIDEAFLDLTQEIDPYKTGRLIRHKILQDIGIPTSVGIGPTKTLAKIAADIAKKNPTHKGVFYIKNTSDIHTHLSNTQVSSVWGIGHRLAKRLNNYNIYTALELISHNDQWIRKNLSIIGLRTVWELRGQACISLEHTPASKKSITSTRSFGRPVTTQKEIEEAVSTYIVRACQKLRHQNSVANYLYVFMRTSKHRRNQPQRTADQVIKLPQATNYPPEVIKIGKKIVSNLFSPGYQYKKAGVILTGLHGSNHIQQNLFEPQTNPKKTQAIESLEKINKRFGRDVVKIAATGIHKNWKMRCELRSPSYTTNWKELLVIKN